MTRGWCMNYWEIAGPDRATVLVCVQAWRFDNQYRYFHSDATVRYFRAQSRSRVGRTACGPAGCTTRTCDDQPGEGSRPLEGTDGTVPVWQGTRGACLSDPRRA